MKLGMQERTNISSGVLDSTKVEFEANAVSFYAQVTGLAKDKVRYPMRELCSNAWDESKGNFEVQLPTSLDPTFRVRDYGPGMSHETMKNVYARLYASTKRSDNGKVGGWGLGSKSPFAYLITDNGAGSYTVTSYHGGMMRSYVMSLSSEGELMMDLMIEAPTTERFGLEVSFAVRKEDIHDFRRAARDVLWGFNPRPTVTPAVEWDDPVIQTQGSNWTNYKTGTVPFYGPHVRMGCAVYPFDLDQIKSTGFLTEDDCILFEAPIGSLKVTLSREAIAYSDGTKATLGNLVRDYETAFISQLQAKVDAADNLFAGAKAFEDGCEGLGQNREEKLRRVVTWRGHQITITIVNSGFKMCLLSDGWHHFDKFDGSGVRSSWAHDAKIVIEHTPRYSLSRFAIAGLIGEKILWVRCKRADRERTLQILGNPKDVIDLDTYKVPVEKRIGKLVRKRRTIEVGESGTLHTTTQEIDLADGGFYVETAPSGWRRRRRGDHYRISEYGVGHQIFTLEKATRLAVKWGFLDPGTTILVKDQDQEVPDNWTFLGPDLIEQLKTKIDLSEHTGLRHKTLSSLDYKLKGLEKMDVWEKAPADLQQFKSELSALVEVLKANKVEETDSDKAIDVLQSLGVDTSTPVVQCPVKELEAKWHGLCEGYPLLRMIVAGMSTYSDSPDVKRKLKYYFDLLARPPLEDEAISTETVADNGDSDATDASDDDDVDLDEAA